MSTLQDRLDRIRDGFDGNASPEVKAVMANATEELRDSGIMDRLPAAGSLLPAFELPDTEGSPVRSADLLERGPLIISFYRGAW